MTSSRNSRRRPAAGRVLAVAAVLAMVAVATVTFGRPAVAATGTPARGGSLTVLENSGADTWHGLDPALDSGFLAFPFYMNAIYGNLFEQGANNKPIPDLATGYKVSPDARTATITLRRGVTFTDGTPFDAAAVKWNIQRDLAPGGECDCAQDFPIASIGTPNAHTVVLHLSRPFAPIIEAFFTNAPNWIVSPTAVRKEGAKQFAITPVGAGPFVVTSDKIGATLQLTRNPHYWDKGKPYLDSLTFSLIGTDEAAYEALQAKQAQVYMGLGTVALAQQARKTFKVTSSPATDPWGVQFNTTKAPFNNLKAREAIYYATNAAAIDKSILLGQGSLSESLTGPQGLFYEPKVPGYRTYDLAKAKALVRQIGGLHIQLLDVASPLGVQIDTALKSEWSQAGIGTTVNSQPLGVYIQLAKSNSWQAQVAALGDFDPALGFGLPFRFLSTGPFTGAHDPALDKLINEGVSTTNQAKRARIYRQAFKVISDQAYAAMLFTEPAYNVTAHSVSAPGLTTVGPEVLWEDATIHS